jgi:hypothetical protein
MSLHASDDKSEICKNIKFCGKRVEKRKDHSKSVVPPLDISKVLEKRDNESKLLFSSTHNLNNPNSQIVPISSSESRMSDYAYIMKSDNSR